MLTSILQWQDLDTADRRLVLSRPAVRDSAGLQQEVVAILQQVRASGDEAIRALTERFDGVLLDDTRVTDEEFRDAEAQLTTASIEAIELAIGNVRRFHEAQVQAAITVETMPGVLCERVSQPIDAVGLYVPAGSAPLPSAAIMLAVPAAIAGCPQKILCTPPRRDGRADPAVLVAASRAGVHDIFKIGGAQAIAAMAYGTETVPAVYKLFGPGNAWVTLAKSLVSTGMEGVAIDMPAGPSEVLVIADASASPVFVAADLLSQAEHGPDSQVILLTTSDDIASEVQAAIQTQLQTLPRAEIAQAALQHARIIVVDTIATAVNISNAYAPEHLILHCDAARDLLPGIRNAGSVFVGHWTPESVGDYCSGTNHVLPTYGFARAYSGLGVDQFQRQMTVQELTPQGLSRIGAAVIELAQLEGLDAHAAAVALRLEETP